MDEKEIIGREGGFRRAQTPPPLYTNPGLTPTPSTLISEYAPVLILSLPNFNRSFLTFPFIKHLLFLLATLHNGCRLSNL